ncbi:MAG: hypothetical protein ABI679_05690 [Gemmatimonadota bacterium]
MLNSFDSLLILVAAGGLLLDSPRRRALALAGVVLGALAVAAFEVRVGTGSARTLAQGATESNAPRTFLLLNTALLLVGIGFAVAAALITRIRDRDRSGVSATGSILVVLGGVGFVVGLVPLGTYLGPASIVVTAAVMAASMVAIALVSRTVRLAHAWTWLDRHLIDRNPPPLLPVLSSSLDILWLVSLVVASIAMGLAPSLRACALATMVAATVSHLMMRRAGRGSPVPILPILAAFIIPVFTTLTAISGSSNPSLHSLLDAPLSPAAEVRLVPWVALACWGFAGLWPLHGVVPRLTAPLAGLLLTRLAAGPLPDGLAHWAPLFTPVILLGILHAAATIGVIAVRRSRIEALLVAFALLGIIAGGHGMAGAYGFLGASVLYPWGSRLADRLTDSRIMSALTRVLWLPLVWAALQVVAAGLRFQVTYTVIASLGLAAALWSARGTPSESPTPFQLRLTR